MTTTRKLLLELDIVLEEYSLIISRARDPALTSEERLKLVRASASAWKRMAAAQRHLELGSIIANDAANGVVLESGSRFQKA